MSDLPEWLRDVPDEYMAEARAELALEEARYYRERHDAITAELVACTLGQRTRLELRVDTAGRLAHSLQRARAWLHELAGYRYPAAN